MMLRPAQEKDVERMMEIRFAVRENRLSDPRKVSNSLVSEMIGDRGFGLVYEQEGQVLGFTIVDLAEENLWALFVDPDWESRGIGRALLSAAVTQAFKSVDRLWLSTDPGTRAEQVYLKHGWIKKGITPEGEVRLVMDSKRLNKMKSLNSNSDGAS